MAANKTIVQGFDVLLANTYSLASSTHFAHWNVMGNAFFTLHDAFKGQYEDLYGAADAIAERIRQMGYFSIGGLAQMNEYSTLPTMESGLSPEQMAEFLVDCHVKLVAKAYDLRKLCGKEDDLENQDFVMGRIQDHQKTIWMLNSFLNEQSDYGA